MFNSLISNINFTNLGAKSKRKAMINLTLTMHPSVNYPRINSGACNS